MNRRAFLATLAAGLALDPERLLWRPGAKLISIPKPPYPTLRIMRQYQAHPMSPYYGETFVRLDIAYGLPLIGGMDSAIIEVNVPLPKDNWVGIDVIGDTAVADAADVLAERLRVSPDRLRKPCKLLACAAFD